MAEFSLPKNSKIVKGNKFDYNGKSNNVKHFHIYRWSPDDQQNPRLDTYTLDLDDCGPMVLDALIKIKNEIDTGLTFRRSCREGICGSCSMNIDGTNTLACLKSIEEVQGDVYIYPLPHMSVIKDLVPDLTNAYKQLASVKPWLQQKKMLMKMAKEHRLRRKRKLDGLWECILCYVQLLVHLLVEW